MTEQPEPPPELRAALAFGQPLRDGVEHVRANGAGTAVVLGHVDADEKWLLHGDRVDQEVTAETIQRASVGEGATVVTTGLDRIIRKHVILDPPSTFAADGHGTRHIATQRYAVATGHPVVVVSKERRTITLFSGTARHILPTRTDLLADIDGRMDLLRTYQGLVRPGDALSSSALAEVRETVRALDGLLTELGVHGEARRKECAAIADVLGIGSSSTLRNLGQPVRPATIPLGGVKPPEPQQLPPLVPHFTDREAELAGVIEFLSTSDTTPKIGVIVGAAGIGKSAFAVKCADTVRGRFTDGILYVDLRGFHPADTPADATEVLGGFLADLGMPDQAIPRERQRLINRYRSLLRGRRLLIILDNALHPDQVRPLLPGATTCGVLVTSRKSMAGLTVRQGAARWTLDVLPSDDAVGLLGVVAGGPADRSHLPELAELCGYHPLALCIAGTVAADQSPVELARFVADLRHARLDALSDPDDDDASVKATFSLSYRALPDTTQRTFRLLGLYPGPTISPDAAEVLAGDSAGVRQLLGMHMLENTGDGRYRYHDLLRAYAMDCANESESADERRLAICRVLDWLRRTAEAYDRVIDPWRPRMSPAGDEMTVPADRAAAREWFDGELAGLAVATQSALGYGEHELAWRLALAPSAYFFSRKPWATWIATQEAGLAAARASGALDAEAWLCDGLGVAHREQDRRDAAIDYFDVALRRFHATGDLEGEAETTLHLAQTYRELGELEHALQLSDTARSLFRRAGDRHGEAKASNLLGGVYATLGDPETALVHTDHAVTIFTDLGVEFSRAWAVNNRAVVLARFGRRTEAIAAFRAALAVRKDIDRYGLAFTHQGLGDVLRDNGDLAGAREHWRAAVEIFDDIGDPRAAQLHERLDAPSHEPNTTSATRVSETAAGSRLRELSERLAADLDVASSTDDHRLGTGLYVRRTQQDDVLAMLRPDAYEKPLLVRGAPGEGKSSMLWGLYKELTESITVEPYLLNAPWLAGADGLAPLITAGDLRQAAVEAIADGRVAVFLVDTVDLLLRDDPQSVLDLCEIGTETGAQFVLTSRPEEALKLPRTAFRTVGLKSYDSAELPLAIDKHAAAFCPTTSRADRDARTRAIIDGAARGLPVREIVVNPLHLRLLFEVYAPYFPAAEHDVSSLYELYWQRRVRQDWRFEGDTAGQADMSRTAQHVAIALLAAGRLERHEEHLFHSAAAVAVAAGSGTDDDYQDALATITRDVTTLRQRGVLVRSEHGIRFFHQTVFEYAAALGLLSRDGTRAVRYLVGQLRARPDDLFVGAVVEQALVLAMDDPLTAVVTTETVNEMATSGGPSLQRIALGVLAHRPMMQDTVEYLINATDTAALRRYAQALPTVVKADPTQQATALAMVWGRHESVRESVLSALERLGAREPAIVLATLRQLDCVDVALAWPNDPARMIKLVARVLVAVAPADPMWTRDRLLFLFDEMIKRNTHRNVPVYLVDLIVREWTTFGCPATAVKVRTRIVRAQRRRDAGAGEMRTVLGQVQALAWRDQLSVRAVAGRREADDWWSTRVARLCRRLERDYYDVLGNAQLVATAELVTTGTLTTTQATATITRLTEVRGSAPFAVGNWLFRRLLSHDGTHGGGPVAPLVPIILSLLDGLPARGNEPNEGPQRWAHVTRQTLHEATITSRRLATLLADAPAARNPHNWLVDDQLAVLLVAAAVGGHPVAAAALERVAAHPGSLSATGQKNVSYAIVHHLGERPSLLSLLIELAVHRATATPLSEVVATPDDSTLEQLRLHSARLTELVWLLFDGSGDQRKEAASLWRRLYRVRAVPAPDHSVLATLFQTTSEQAARGNILELATDVALAGDGEQHVVDQMLRGLFQVDRVTNAVTSPGGKPAGHVSRIARTAWLRLVCHRRPTSEVDIDELLGVALAAPTTADNLTVMGPLITRFVNAGAPDEAIQLLLRVIAAVDTIGLTGKQENSVANKLRMSIRMIFRHAIVADQRDLLAKVPGFPRAHARIVVAAAAAENFDVLRPQLAALLTGGLPEGAAQQVHDDMRVRSRSSATMALPLLLLPLAGNGDN